MADSILPPEDAPMVTCEVCGRQYKKGMPHHAFCSGVPAGSECYMCGAKEDGEDAVDLEECESCGEIYCEDCINDHECD